MQSTDWTYLWDPGHVIEPLCAEFLPNMRDWTRGSFLQPLVGLKAGILCLHLLISLCGLCRHRHSDGHMPELGACADQGCPH